MQAIKKPKVVVAAVHDEVRGSINAKSASEILCALYITIMWW